MQHLEYAAQLRLKSQSLLAQLAQHGVVAKLVRPPVSGPRLHYRHKARLGVRALPSKQGGEQVLVGFRESFSSRVARMSDCKVLALPFAQLLPDLQATLEKLSQKHRIPQIEVAAGDVEQAIIVRHLDPLDAADRAHLIALARRYGIRVYLQSAGYDSLELLWPLRAEPWLTYSLVDFGLTYRFQVTDFTQVNPYMNRMLANAVACALRPEPGTVVADLFCGIGNFSLPIARLGGLVKGYEASAGAIARARSNASLNGLGAQCEFHIADLYDPDYELPADAQQVLLDPPRSGAGPHLATWLRSPSLQRLAYVSCNPVTFASDAAVLVEQGFTLAQVGIFDMFPHTSHVETLGVFVREAGNL
jgi:23S rRNA (uracil1939-C5)-methyltransferase